MSDEIIDLRKVITNLVDEYNEKRERIAGVVDRYNSACRAVNSVAHVSGVFGKDNIRMTRLDEQALRDSLLTSAWRALSKVDAIDYLMGTRDKDLFERALQDPPPFNMENIKATFGEYILNPRLKILSNLADVFCLLDPYYKSHDKIKVGVKGMPKRIIIKGLTGSWSHGANRLRDIMNAIAMLLDKPKLDNGMFHDFVMHKTDHKVHGHIEKEYGVWLKRFKNDNAHLFFNNRTAKAINLGLAEYYGDVLPDCYEAKPDKPQASTEVAKDLQYYPTPDEAVDYLLRDVLLHNDALVLEPSCGCGQILDGLRRSNSKVKAHGYEINHELVEICREKNHNVVCRNFLEVEPQAIYDRVIMNPPFYGKHYEKHIRHALKFLKDDGILYSILPITAKLDHGLLDDLDPFWHEMPARSFAKSGTNINTVICRIRK